MWLSRFARGGSLSKVLLSKPSRALWNSGWRSDRGAYGGHTSETLTPGHTTPFST